MEIKVLKDILGVNEQIARNNRHVFDSRGIFTINLMSSPGAGKTSFILETIGKLEGKANIGVIEGDVSSSVDAETIGKTGVPVIQINTGGGCHLDANMVQRAIENLPLEKIKILFIENVGNLICPAEFNLGEHIKVVLSSTPEGSDKPLKYPAMFHEADVVLLNKIDLFPHLNFDNDAFSRAIRGINEKAEILEISCTTGEGIDRWISWLTARISGG